ncbi:hypothetical protein NL676_015565 [Syzygium grande]|nr:hypothetical protein NL676_015565 [Syzygium grande]
MLYYLGSSSPPDTWRTDGPPFKSSSICPKFFDPRIIKFHRIFVACSKNALIAIDLTAAATGQLLCVFDSAGMIRTISRLNLNIEV